MVTGRLRIFAVAVLWLWVAIASPSPLRGLNTARAAEPTAASSVDPGQARSHYERGAEAFRAGRLDEAIAAFEAAYRTDPVAAFLLNIAQAHRLKTPPDCAQALRHYELFLAAEPLAGERAEVERYIAEMNACLDDRRAAAAVPATPPRPEAAPPAHTRAPPSRLPLWITGAGLVTAVAGAVTYAVARAKFDELRSMCPCPDDTIDSWQRTTNIAYGLLAIGGAVTAGGLALWLWPSATDPERRPVTGSAAAAATVLLMPEVRGFSLTGRF